MYRKKKSQKCLYCSKICKKIGKPKHQLRLWIKEQHFFDVLPVFDLKDCF